MSGSTGEHDELVVREVERLQVELARVRAGAAEQRLVTVRDLRRRLEKAQSALRWSWAPSDLPTSVDLSWLGGVVLGGYLWP